MRIVVGHANPDFDAYAAMIAATKLFEGSRAVFLGSQNANVRSFHNLHEEFLDFVELRGLDTDAVDSVVMVDTRDPSRLGELGPVTMRPGVEVIVYDHHPRQEGDIEGAEDRSREVGSTTAILVHEIRDRGIALTPLEASAMLLGIHEDTGSLTFPNATAYDADAAAWLMATGADMEVVNQFLARTLDPAQRDLLAQLEGTLTVWDINGQQVAVGFATADEYVDSAGVLTHYVVEDMGFRVAVAVVAMPERLQIVARSRLAEVDVGAVMGRMGGGGHAQAASAGFRDLSIDEALRRVRSALEAEVKPPLRALDVMSSPVRVIDPETTMREAGELMARWGHGGLPVVVEDSLVGLVTRKDVDKALRHKLEHAPVKGFMGRDVLTVAPQTDLRELETLLASRGIGRIPVVKAGILVGIVTRKDVLRAEHGDAYLDRGASKEHPRARAAFIRNVEALLPPQVRLALTSVGEVGQELGVTAHVVGGFVRDMVIGRPNLDVDIVVEGDGVEFALKAAERLGARVKVHRRFGTAVLVVSKELHIDVASSRSEYYTKPGALPTVERSSLRQDLFRRDFTINAMSACLDPDCWGAIADPFGGLSDIRKRRLRIMHSLSFIDDPTRVLRAARFEIRYGFGMDVHTLQLALRAVELGVLEEVSGSRIRDELYDILDEKAPLEILRRLDELAALPALSPTGVAPARLMSGLVGCGDALASFTPRLSRPVNTRAVFVACIAGSAEQAAGTKWIRRLRIGKEVAEPAFTLLARGPGVVRSLRDRRGMRDSRLFRLLDPLPPEALACLWGTGDALVRERIERYALDLAGIPMTVSGHDLISMGASPGERFSAILAQARDDLLDGRVSGRDAELANLRRLAVRAGILPTRKGTA